MTGIEFEIGWRLFAVLMVLALALWVIIGRDGDGGRDG